MFNQNPNPESVFVNIQGAVYEFKTNRDPVTGDVISYQSICAMIKRIVENGGMFEHTSGDHAISTYIKVPQGVAVQVLTGEAFAKFMAEQERMHKLAQLANGGIPRNIRQ